MIDQPGKYKKVGWQVKRKFQARLGFIVDKRLKDEFEIHCARQGYLMSDKIREFMKQEVSNYKVGK